MRRYYRTFVFALLPMMFGAASYAQNSAGRPAVREELEESHEKERSQWHMSFFKGGPMLDLERAQSEGVRQFQAMDNSVSFKQASVPAWQQVGGSQGAKVSGRATSIAFDLSDLNTIYVGEPQAGVWKTTNRGSSWVCMTDSWPTGAMGAVGVDPLNPKIIYAATGDMDPSDGVGGVGMYRSTDGGLNWTLVATAADIGSKSLQILCDSMTTTGQPAHCANVYVTTNSGVSKSSDGGLTWKRILSQAGITSMVMNPVTTTTLVAGSNSGRIKRSDDGGVTWTTVSSGLPSFGRIDIAISASNPDILYGSADMSGGAGLLKSTDGGSTWSLTHQNGPWLGQQGWYANAIAVNPTNPDMIVVGGLDIYRSDDGGLTFQRKTDWTTSSSASDFSHADIHRLVFSASGLYALTDGGVFHSSSNGDGWKQEMNRGLATLQFVGFDAAPDLSFFIGGAQDNGVDRVIPGQSFFQEVGGGDGGRTYVSQTDGGLRVYSTYYNANMRKSLDGGQSWLNGGQNVLVNDTLINENTPFYMNYSVCESDPDFVAIAGRSRVWYSNNGAGDFNSISNPGQIGGGPAVVHIAAADPTTVFAAGNNGYMYHIWSGGTWKRSQKGLGNVTGIIADPDNASIVYVCVGGSGNPHFYVSTDTGYTFKSVAVNMPDVPAMSMALGPDKAIYIGTSVGVVASHDVGVHWIPLANGLPILEVMSLQVRGGKTLVAGTYGRGAYKLDVTGLDFSAGVHAVVAQATSVTLGNIYPNPIVSERAATIQFSLPAEGPVTLAIYDQLGRSVKILANEFLQKGDYSRTADLTGLATGKYFYALTALGQTVSHSLVISR